MKTLIHNFPKMGRGVVAAKSFKKGEIVEASPVIIMDFLEHQLVAKTLLNLYVFSWRDNCIALALGNGSLFNHDDRANVTWKNDYKNKKIKFIAKRTIKKGEQLFLNYGYDPVFYWQDYLKKKEQLREKQK